MVALSDPARRLPVPPPAISPGEEHLYLISRSSLGDYLASGPSLTILDPLGAIPQRFYRVRQLE